MTLSDYCALGVEPDANHQGTSSHELRRIQRFLWTSPGIVSQQLDRPSLSVSGCPDLRYFVQRGTAVLARDDSYADGFYLACVDNTYTEPVATADPSYPRIDTIWIRANDAKFGDTDLTGTLSNHIEIGVTSGVAKANPSEPDLPARAMKLASMMLPAGATSTANATQYGDVDYAVPYGASLGILDRIAENRDLKSSSSDTKAPFLSKSFYFPTDRWVLLHAYVCVSTPNKNNGSGVAAVQFYLDGELYTTRKIRYSDSWVTYEPTTTIRLSAGHHTVGIAMYNEAGDGYVTHYQHGDPDERGNYYSGRVLVVKDEGVAQ